MCVACELDSIPDALTSGFAYIMHNFGLVTVKVVDKVASSGLAN